jgi:hypothetical protein
VQRFSGHQSPDMLLLYTRPADERVDAMVDSMDGGNAVPLRKAQHS